MYLRRVILYSAHFYTTSLFFLSRPSYCPRKVVTLRCIPVAASNFGRISGLDCFQKHPHLRLVWVIEPVFIALFIIRRCGPVPVVCIQDGRVRTESCVSHP